MKYPILCVLKTSRILENSEACLAGSFNLNRHDPKMLPGVVRTASIALTFQSETSTIVSSMAPIIPLHPMNIRSKKSLFFLYSVKTPLSVVLMVAVTPPECAKKMFLLAINIYTYH